MKVARAEVEVNLVKERILDSALDIIVTEGLSALTMRRLAKSIDMAASNIYNYYANKDEIYITLMIKGFRQLIADLQSVLSEGTDPLIHARKCIQTYLDFGISNNRYYEIMFSSSTPKYRDYLGTEQEALSAQEHAVSMELAELSLGLLGRLAEANGKSLSAQNGKLIFTSIWSLLHGMVSLHNSQNIAYVVDDSATVYAAIIEHLITQIEQRVA